MIKKPKVPEYRDGSGTAPYLRLLAMFLKDFCMEVWTEMRSIRRELDALKKDGAA